MSQDVVRNPKQTSTKSRPAPAAPWRERSGIAFAVFLAAAMAISVSATDVVASGTPWWREAVAEPVIERAPFDSGEQLLFAIRVLGKQVGSGELRVGKETRRGGRQIRVLSATIRSLGFFEQVFPVRDEVTSHVDVATVTPVRAKLVVNENRRPVREVALTFAGAGDGYVHGTRTIEGRSERIDVRTPVRALDPLSAVYHLRSRALTEGDVFPIFVHNGKRVYRADISVDGTEDVWTDLGLRKGWKLRMKIRRADGTRPEWRQNMALWLSADRARVPLKLSFPLPVGRVEALLSGARGIGDASPPAEVRRAVATAPAPRTAPTPAR